MHTTTEMKNYITLTDGALVRFHIHIRDIISYCNHRIKGSMINVRWSKEPLRVDQSIDEISFKILNS